MLLSQALLVLLAACSDGSGASATARWRAVTVTRMGAVQGPGALADVWDLEVGPRGEVLVMQMRPPGIVVFDSAGGYVRTVGRAGEGPGEFESIGRAGWRADSLWVIDFGRLHVFDAGLTWVRTITPRITAPEGLYRIVPGPLMADGSIVGIPLGMPGTAEEPVTLLDESGAILRELVRLPAADRTVRLEFRTRPAVSVQNPWTDTPLWLPAPDGTSIVVVDRRVATGPRGAFTVTRIGLGADTLMHALFEYGAVPLDEAIRGRTVRRVAQRFATDAAPLEALLVEVERALEAPPYLPPVSEFVMGRDGTLWLRREALEADSVDWTVLDARGAHLGDVRLDARLRLLRGEAGRAWAVRPDSLDVPFVEVLRMGR